MKVYVVEMLKWGGQETHHYVLGCYSSIEKAEYASEVEITWRAQKYTSQIREVELDQDLDEDAVEYHKECMETDKLI